MKKCIGLVVIFSAFSISFMHAGEFEKKQAVWLVSQDCTYNFQDTIEFEGQTIGELKAQAARYYGLKRDDILDMRLKLICQEKLDPIPDNDRIKNERYVLVINDNKMLGLMSIYNLGNDIWAQAYALAQQAKTQENAVFAPCAAAILNNQLYLAPFGKQKLAAWLQTDNAPPLQELILAGTPEPNVVQSPNFLSTALELKCEQQFSCSLNYIVENFGPQRMHDVLNNNEDAIMQRGDHCEEGLREINMLLAHYKKGLGEVVVYFEHKQVTIQQLEQCVAKIRVGAPDGPNSPAFCEFFMHILKAMKEKQIPLYQLRANSGSPNGPNFNFNNNPNDPNNPNNSNNPDDSDDPNNPHTPHGPNNASASQWKTWAKYGGITAVICVAGYCLYHWFYSQEKKQNEAPNARA